MGSEFAFGVGKHGFEKDPKLSFSGFVSKRTSLRFRLFGGGLKGCQVQNSLKLGSIQH